jgi:hypothetical protein
MMNDPPVDELVDFRAGLYQTLTGWADAVFELGDAVLCSRGPVSSMPALSLEPVFRRGHGSLYKGLDRGWVDPQAMRDLLVKHYPSTWPAVFAVDASTWARDDAETSPGRGYYHSASRHNSSGKPIAAGWSYQWIAGLNQTSDSWAAPVDAIRLCPGQDHTEVTATQIRTLTSRLTAAGRTDVPLFVFDAGYDPIGLTFELSDLKAHLVVRIRDDRVFYDTPSPPVPGQPGRPRRHGNRYSCTQPDTWPTPDQQLAGHTDQYGHVKITAWHGLHPQLAHRGHWAHYAQTPIVTGTIISIDVEHLPGPANHPKQVLWLWAAAGHNTHLDIDQCWRAYLHRFDIEHMFRFMKTTLGWTTPRPRDPEQADTWTWLIAATHTQLRLARPLVNDHRLPWERQLDPGKLTPNRVRRGFPQLAPTIGTPANPPKPSKAGPGRPTGTPTGPRQRYPAIKAATAKV